MIYTAPAKLNLALHVTSRRADGYHMLDSLVAFAEVGDRISLTSGPLSLTIGGPFADDLKIADDNLCLRAARMIGGKAALRLTKNLPVASGIGGGSADAAAVLRAFADRGLALPPDVALLGADVPVCLAGQPARMRGIGEQLDPVPPVPALPVVLVNPGVALSTPEVFRALQDTENDPLPEPEWQDAESLIAWLARCRNDLTAPACRIAPIIGDVLSKLSDQGALLSRMSGSGATCFGIFPDPDHAIASARTLTQLGWWAVATRLAPVEGGR